MNQIGSDLMLISKANYMKLLEIMIQLDRRNKLAPDEREFLRKLVDYQ
jgi:hypothetical protein